jgi:DNA-binding MarR family transcriptional regulator
VQLTERGKALRRKIRRTVRKIEQELEAELGSDSYAQLRELLVSLNHSATVQRAYDAR